MEGQTSNANIEETSSEPPIHVTRVESRSLTDGVYVKGMVNGEPVTFTADTGASKTIISTKVYEKIPVARRPVLDQSLRLIGAGGAPIKGAGRAEVDLKLGPLELRRDVMVAEIEDDALLGYDILMGSTNGPADILLSSNKIVLDGVDIPVIQIGQERQARRVTVADSVHIPGQTEAVIDVFIERCEADEEEASEFVIEPTEQFRGRYPLQMAATVVNINGGPTCKVRVMNPFSSEVELKQDAVIGRAERVEKIISVIARAEDVEEGENRSAVRRIQLSQPQSKDSEPMVCAEADVPEHLTSLYKRSAEGKTEHERKRLAALLVKYQDTFSKSEWDIGLTDLAEHSINTGDANPIKQRPRRVPLAYADEEKQAIEDLLQKGVIRKSTSPWSSPIVLVKKKSGAVRPCVDYRRLNALVKPDGFPLPRVQDCLDAVAGSALFSSFDLTSGYFQIPLKQEDIPKSAFCCKYGHFEMLRLPFGLNNAASTFQRTMELALQGLQWVTCLIYIDDIIVFGADFDQHMARVEEVLDRIAKAGLKLKPDKCHMLQTEVVFLGHLVSKKGILPDPANIMKIVDWPRPTNCKQVKQFVATGSYYRRFVRDYARIARPLIDLTRKDAIFQWSPACEDAFKEIKKILIGPEVMGYPMNEAGTFYLDTDASGIGLGGVLSQIQEGRERVIAYGSRGLSKAERNYCITEQELLAVVFMIQHFRQYLLGRRFIVRTDHQALVWLFSLKEPNGKIARWIEILASYDFSVEYRPGKKMSHCDALSRCETPQDCQCSDVDMSEPLKCGPCSRCRRRAEVMALKQKDHVTEDRESTENTMQDNPGDEKIRATTSREEDECVLPNTEEPSQGPSKVRVTPRSWLWLHSAEDVRASQRDDPTIAPILQAMLNSSKPSGDEMEATSPATRHYWLLWENLRLVNGVLCKAFAKRNGTGEYLQLIAPTGLRHDIIHHMHSALISGHVGVKRTKEKISKSYYWFNLNEDVKSYIRKCDICAADKPPPKTPRAPMGHLVSGAPWDTLALDYLGPLPCTARGNKYILVITDHFTKYVEVLAVPNQHAEDCASRVVNEVIARWGTPLRIHSDQGSTFESHVFKEMCELLEVKKSRTSARNPRGNGQTERFNRTLLKMIRAYLTGEQEDWDLHLGCLAGAYRSSPNESTHLTPNLLNLGREIRLPADVIFGHVSTAESETPRYGEYVESLRDRLLHAHEVARKYLQSSSKRSKEVYDTRLAHNNFKQGDMVWCLLESRKVGIAPKLQKRYEGPYVVIERLSPVNFKIQVRQDGSAKVLHHNKLKFYKGDSPPSWVKRASKRLLKQ